MSGPVTEVVTFPVSSWNEHAMKCIRICMDQPGMRGISWGPSIEHDRIYALFLDWDSYEIHEEFMKKPIYKTMLKPFVKGEGLMYHVPLDSSRFTASETGPITEYLQVTVKPGMKEEFAKGIDAIYDAAKTTPYFKGGNWGWSREKENVAIIFINWTSKEDHMRKFRENPEFKETFAPFLATVEREEMLHIKIQDGLPAPTSTSKKITQYLGINWLKARMTKASA